MYKRNGITESQLVYNMYVNERLSRKEIADEMGISIRHVSNILHNYCISRASKAKGSKAN